MKLTNIDTFNEYTVEQILDRLLPTRNNQKPSNLAIFNPERGIIKAVFSDTVGTQRLIRERNSLYVCTLDYQMSAEEIKKKLEGC